MLLLVVFPAALNVYLGPRSKILEQHSVIKDEGALQTSSSETDGDEENLSENIKKKHEIRQEVVFEVYRKLAVSVRTWKIGSWLFGGPSHGGMWNNQAQHLN